MCSPNTFRAEPDRFVMMRVRIVIRWAPVGVNARVRRLVDSLACVIRGHDDKVICRNGTMLLQCGRCGHTSNGWHLDMRPPATLR